DGYRPVAPPRPAGPPRRRPPAQGRLRAAGQAWLRNPVSSEKPGFLTACRVQSGVIRRADPDRDNAALCALSRRCPQGRRLRFYHDRADFLERGRSQPECDVFTADEAGRLVAAAAVARKPMRLGGDFLPTAYVFDLMVDPSFRGRGLA